MSIEVKNVTKLYGEQKALNNVSFNIKSGEIVGFLGPNGAGKSTMMKIITGYIPASSGEVYVNSVKVSDEDVSIRQKVGYLPESNPLYPEMYIKEYLLFVAGMYGIKGNEAKSRVAEMIDKTGLNVEMHKKIGQLSKGYKQRVGLAQALIHKPEVLILDEPTSGLDPNQIVEIRNLISEIGKERTVMLSTHIMQEVEAICDKIIIIKEGRIVADDEKENIKKTQGKIAVVVEFSKKVAESDLLEIEGVQEIRNVNLNHWILTSASDVDIRTNIFNFAVKKQMAVLSLQRKEKNLEELFRELTN